MIHHPGGFFERAAVLQVSDDARRAKDVPGNKCSGVAPCRAPAKDTRAALIEQPSKGTGRPFADDEFHSCAEFSAPCRGAKGSGK
jgi:hypothetical protein